MQINLYAQLHRFRVYPDNQTAYGTPRQFKAMIANIATSNTTSQQKMNGTLTFLGNAGQSLCNATLNNNATMSGTQVGALDLGSNPVVLIANAGSCAHDNCAAKWMVQTHGGKLAGLQWL